MADANYVALPRILRHTTDPPSTRRTWMPRVMLCTDDPQENPIRQPRGVNGRDDQCASSSRLEDDNVQSSPRVVVVATLCTSVVDPLEADLPPVFFPSLPLEETGTTGFLSSGLTTTRHCRALAVLLRLRVTQIVLGIVTLVLGASACLDLNARETLALGVPAGSLTLLAASGQVRDVRRQASAGFEHKFCPQFGVLCLALTAVLANVFLLVLSIFSAGTGTPNQRSLGVLLTCATLPVLLVETAACLVRWAWASRKWTE